MRRCNCRKSGGRKRKLCWRNAEDIFRDKTHNRNIAQTYALKYYVNLTQSSSRPG